MLKTKTCTWKKLFGSTIVSISVLIFVSFFTGCFSLPAIVTSGQPSKEMAPSAVASNYGLTLGDDESIVILERKTETGKSARLNEPEEWKVFVDGVESKIIKKHETIAFVLPNGTHKMYVYMGTLGLAKIVYKSVELTVNAQSNYIRLSTYLAGGMKPDVVLKQN